MVPLPPVPKSKEGKDWQEEPQAHKKELQPTFRSIAEAELQGQRVGYQSIALENEAVIENLIYTFAMSY